MIYTDPEAASVGATPARFSVTVPMSEVAKTATYTHAYAESKGFLSLLSDGSGLTGAYALGPGRRRVDAAGHAGHAGPGAAGCFANVIQPFPTFSEIYVAGLKALHRQITAARAQEVTMTGGRA